MASDGGLRRCLLRVASGAEFIVSEEAAAYFSEVAEIVEMIDSPPEDDWFEVAVAQVQGKVSPLWMWNREGPGRWTAAAGSETVAALGLRLSGPGTGIPAFRVETVLVETEVPAAAHAEMTIFCAAANQFFSGWNLYVGPHRGGEHVFSIASFLAIKSGAVPPAMTEFFIWRSIRAAAVAAPAVQAVIDSASVREALAVADQSDDTLEWADVTGWRAFGGSE